MKQTTPEPRRATCALPANPGARQPQHRKAWSNGRDWQTHYVTALVIIMSLRHSSRQVSVDTFIIFGKFAIEWSLFFGIKRWISDLFLISDH